MAGLKGLGPSTFRVTGGRSNQLSYSPKTHLCVEQMYFTKIRYN